MSLHASIFGSKDSPEGSGIKTTLPRPALDRASPVPLYYQLAQNMEHAIDSGELASGTHLENELDLARQLGVSRPTVRRAIGYLAGRGLLIRRRIWPAGAC